MGLDVSHDCWSGAYSAFMRWRTKVAEVAGYGNLMEMQGFAEGGGRPWPSPETDALVHLLHHSDCDGELAWEVCGAIADRLESLVPALETADKLQNAGGHLAVLGYAGAAQRWVEGLRAAHEARENVEFR